MIVEKTLTTTKKQQQKKKHEKKIIIKINKKNRNNGNTGICYSTQNFAGVLFCGLAIFCGLWEQIFAVRDD